jgi:hypothetical protein
MCVTDVPFYLFRNKYCSFLYPILILFIICDREPELLRFLEHLLTC